MTNIRDISFQSNPFLFDSFEQPSPVVSSSSVFGTLGALMLSAVETNVSKRVLKKTIPYSLYDAPMTNSLSESGYSRNWGDASSSVQTNVMKQILEASNDCSLEDQALLLGFARLESGFNPDAAATTTSAAGVFQLIKSTAKQLGVDEASVFNSKANIEGGIKLFKQNEAIVDRKYPHLSADERAVMLYALHHDGPSLQFGGASIAREKLLPSLGAFRAIANAQ